MNEPARLESVEAHRDTLEALAASDLDLQLVEDARTLLDEADAAQSVEGG